MKKLNDEDFQAIFQDMRSNVLEISGPEENINKDKLEEIIGMISVMIDVVKRYNEKAFSENE